MYREVEKGEEKADQTETGRREADIHGEERSINTPEEYPDAPWGRSDEWQVRDFHRAICHVEEARMTAPFSTCSFLEEFSCRSGHIHCVQTSAVAMPRLRPGLQQRPHRFRVVRHHVQRGVTVARGRNRRVGVRLD